MARVREFVASPARRPGEIVAVTCEAGPGHLADDFVRAGASVFPVSCAGNLHTSTIEMLLRGGAGGVLVLTCPPRDCEHREGPRWTHARVFHGREAELQDRVDRARVRIAHANARERSAALAALRAFAAEIALLDRPAIDEADADRTECEPKPIPRRKRA
jgi:coenzyme F420-reducing hydrogenase delta subunit